ncbi:DNA adenine methylase [Marinitoga hydrogenitolerans DSM 16785]|uniref:DNA adenine methylase n=1 Tax=Marinitoga hydrogenitolerans (strain DSM 16785 / JCM 12826 / AT1271) TaxID=1122195 RepID=A0A1M4TQK0_MARH1|nr:DNA adenine methylase [Marinitoga hydrogenitolerans]SHE46664.1 DNA adenine methylase [Marinitoga hydrogenitolerans DSM 16785]
MARYSLSPLRYPGGKAKLFPVIKEILIKNNLIGSTYVEPFAGGAGLALLLLKENLVKKIIINDLDRSIYAFWYSTLNYTELFIKKIRKANINIDEWYKQKEIQKIKDKVDLFDLGFSTFFLNRTNVSGIIKGGVLGGKSQNGKYKIDCRFNKESLIKRMEFLSSMKKRIAIYNLDVFDLIKKIKYRKNYFIFFDPPYYNKGSELYQNYFTHNEHINLSKKIKTIKKIPWIVTYDNVEQIRQIYNKFYYYEYSLQYTANRRYKGKEIMIYSNLLKPIVF